MTAKKVVITDHNFGELEVEERVLKEAGCKLEAYQCKNPQEVSKALSNASVALVQMAKLDEKSIASMAPSATIVRYGAGYDNIDTESCAKHGVALANVPDYGTEEVAVHAMALVLCLLRKIFELDQSVRDAKWESATILRDTQSAGSIVLGLYGAGRIGLALAKIAQGFSMRILGLDPFADRNKCKDMGVELVGEDSFWQLSDVVSFHAPLTAGTRHALNEKTISKMKKSAIVINCARGELIHSEALVEALKEGRIAGAGVDVFEAEPLPQDHPFRKAPNCILTPHAAWCAKRPMLRLRELAAQEAARAVRGEPLRCPVPIGENSP